MNNKVKNETLCLCIDTSTKVASVSVAKSADGNEIEILYSVFLNDGLTHSEKLIPLINQCMSFCKLNAEDIDLYACVSGPGSYTGLRIGISTANALAQSNDKEIVGVTSLETLAYTFNYFEGLIVPMIDARRDDVFTSVYSSGTDFKEVCAEDAKSVDELLEYLENSDNNILFAGDGAQKAKDRAKMMFSDRAKFADGISNSVNAAIGCEVALKRYFSNDYKMQKVLLPNYIKSTSAKTVAERNKQGKK